MKKLFKLFIFLIIFVVISLVAGLGYINNYANKEISLNKPKTIVIPRGYGISAIAGLLEKEQIITNKLAFKAYIFLIDEKANFKAGEYSFKNAASPKGVITTLTKGDTVTHSITLPEGTLVRDIFGMINSEMKLSGKISAKTINNIKDGDLLPETYFFLRDDDREKIVKRMQQAMANNLQKLWANRQDGLPFDTIEEALILASIVEKETGLDAERGRVASAFINRLNKGMKLQSDPTILYGIYHETGEMRRTIRRSDLNNKNEYNTYYIYGLPPTPITNPGKDAIAAVLNPPKTNDLYFVATGTGGHNFAATLKGHQNNVAKYRAWQRQNGLR